MFLIYKIFLGFLGVYYLAFFGTIFYTSIIEDWCCDHNYCIHTFYSKLYRCISCIKNLRCKYGYKKINNELIENYEAVSGRKYSEKIEIEI